MRVFQTLLIFAGGIVAGIWVTRKVTEMWAADPTLPLAPTPGSTTSTADVATAPKPAPGAAPAKQTASAAYPPSQVSDWGSSLPEEAGNRARELMDEVDALLFDLKQRHKQNPL
jgi:hypothetical protein